ncbi:hypothetical protein C5D07_00935 [Rathayibacter tritici]|uniref:hypothetical protein n=1 Tax=Rathayibacter tritici TaxID=33888 RepID=UPI000CE8B485|nr:hypothetical protein [Rathayibacter tritici]PPF29924.1 hypothetical protein C5C06_06210 [Rathayibacter tritici]PPI19934.1 hypothetical protein C5D07_00935 [Rathayibacter tritici]
MSSTPEDRGPYRLAKLYALGYLSREDLIRELQQWRYVQESQSPLPLHEDLADFVPGSFDEVTDASLDGLIDEEIYELAHQALKAQQLGSAAVDD